MIDLYSLDHIYRNEFGEVQAKSIGVFAGRDRAEAALADLKIMPGFRDHLTGFILEKITVDKTFWDAGFEPDANDARLLPHHERP